MRRGLGVLALLLALTMPAAAQVSGNVPDAAPPAVSVEAQPPSKVTVQTGDDTAPWWGNAVLLAGVSSVVTGFLAHRLGMRKQSDDVSLQRDNVDLTALQQRDQAFKDLLDKFVVLSTQLGTQMTQRDELISENAVNKTRLEDMLAREQAREARERDLIGKVGALEVMVKHVQDCAGGQPCPLAALRSQP